MAARKFDAKKTFFTADTHFGHKRMVEFRMRKGFDSVEQMNDLIISNWNAMVENGDTVFHLGDFYLGRDLKEMDHILGNLNGNITFIAGNHDHKKERKVMETFGPVHDILQAKTIVDGDTQMVSMCHYPMVSWNQMHYGAFHLHGHCHGNLKTKIPRSKDVGSDEGLLFPIPFMEIYNKLKDQPRGIVDHH